VEGWGVQASAWTGSLFGIVWHTYEDTSECYINPEDERVACADVMPFGLVDAEGALVHEDRTLSCLGCSSQMPVMSMAWSGSDFALVWSDSRTVSMTSPDRTLMFQKVGASGVSHPERVELFPGQSPSLAWTGSSYGLLFGDSGALYFSRLDPSGAVEVESVRIPYSDGYTACRKSQELVWTGSEFVFVNVTANLYLSHLDVDGGLVGQSGISSDVASERSCDISLVWTGSLYGVAWQHDFDDTLAANLMLAVLDSSGELIAQPVMITDGSVRADIASLTWNGRSFSMAWVDAMDPRTATLELASMTPECYSDPTCSSHPGVERIIEGDGAGQPRPPLGLTWTGSSYGIGWKWEVGLDWYSHFSIVEPCE